MPIKRTLILGFIIFLATLLYQAPASLVASWIYQKSDQQIVLTQAEGTLWNGKATLALSANTAESPVSVGHLQWQVFPLQLLLGRVYTAISWNEVPPFWLTVETARTHIEHINITIPADIISQLIPALHTAQLGGQLNLRSESISVTSDAIAGEAAIDWQQASSPLSQINPLGSYHAQLSADASGVHIQLSSLIGPLLLDGNGLWSQAQGLSFQGNAKADPAKQKELSELLRILGNEQVPGSGVYQLSVQSQ